MKQGTPAVEPIEISKAMVDIASQTMSEDAPADAPVTGLGRKIEVGLIAAARALCALRGADPDEPITIGNPDGTSTTFDPAWLGYVSMIEVVNDASARAVLA